MTDNKKISLKSCFAITAILIVLVMTVLDVTLVNVALPVMADAFGMTDSAIVWVVTIYQLLITMLLLPVSAYGDIHSYRRSFLVGVAVFTVSSVLCAFSSNFTMIVVSRGFQGVGAACVMGVNIALTRRIYPREILGRGIALNSMVIAIATAAGPTIAGAILSVASWHWLFLINLPFGIIAFIIGYRLLPENPKPAVRRKFDYISAVGNMVVFGSVFFAFGNFSRGGDRLLSVVLLVVGAVVAIFYVRRQRKAEVPMFPVDLFRRRLYSLSILTSVSSFIAQSLAMISLPFLFLGSLGFSEIETGFLMTPWPLVTMMVAPLSARFVERHNPGRVAAAGMAVYALGVTSFLFLSADGVGLQDVVWRMAVCGLGFGMFQTPNNIVMVMATPFERSGSAGGMQSTARLIGQTLGATAVTLVFSTGGSVGGNVCTCLVCAAIFGVTAGVFSLSRRITAG